MEPYKGGGASPHAFWQRKAHYMVYEAQRRGVLPPLKGLKCSDCDREAAHYDHRDYSRPLDVEPVCGSCNKRRGPARFPTATDFNFKRIENG